MSLVHDIIALRDAGHLPKALCLKWQEHGHGENPLEVLKDYRGPSFFEKFSVRQLAGIPFLIYMILCPLAIFLVPEPFGPSKSEALSLLWLIGMIGGGLLYLACVRFSPREVYLEEFVREMGRRLRPFEEELERFSKCTGKSYAELAALDDEQTSLLATELFVKYAIETRELDEYLKDTSPEYIEHGRRRACRLSVVGYLRALYLTAEAFGIFSRGYEPLYAIADERIKAARKAASRNVHSVNMQ